MKNIETKAVKLTEIIKHNKLKVLTGSLEKINKKTILKRAINKGGMELFGFSSEKYEVKLMCFGSKETKYINHQKINEIKKVFIKIFKSKTPAIVLSYKANLPKEIIELANKEDFIILKSYNNSTDLIFGLTNYLNLYLSEPVQVHGTLVEVYGKGVLIKGESGIGKSETALELIKKGHLFIVDDGARLRRIGDKVIGSSPDEIKSLLEVRGIGIIDIEKMFGTSIILEECVVDYVINLKELDNETQFDRLGMTLEYETIQGIKIPKIDIPVSAARNLATLIEVAVAQLRLKQKNKKVG